MAPHRNIIIPTGIEAERRNAVAARKTAGLGGGNWMSSRCTVSPFRRLTTLILAKKLGPGFEKARPNDPVAL